MRMGILGKLFGGKDNSKSDERPSGGSYLVEDTFRINIPQDLVVVGQIKGTVRVGDKVYIEAGSYFAGAIAGAYLLVVIVPLTVLTGSIRYNGVFEKIDVAMVVLMLGGFVLQGALEEVLCRGIVQQLLQKKTSIPVAVGVSAALFTIPHISSMDFSAPAIAVTAVINLILISVIFSLLTVRFRSIWAACGMHSIWNYILYCILGLNLSGNDEIAASVFNMSSVGEIY